MADFSRFLIVTDLDGTFISKKGQLVERNLLALQRFREGGGLFTIATGRSHASIRPILPDVEQLLNTPAVLCNGAYLHSFATGESYCEELMPEQDATDILNYVCSELPDLLIYVLARKQIRFSRFNDDSCRYATFCDDGVVQISAPSNWPRSDWYKIAFRGETERLLTARKMLNARFEGRFGFTTSSAHTLEVQSPTCTKATGLAKLHNYTSELQQRVLIACGDFENDMEMLRVADIAICPENATDAVKQIAHTLCHCDKGLIADVIEGIAQGRITPEGLIANAPEKESQ